MSLSVERVHRRTRRQIGATRALNFACAPLVSPDSLPARIMDQDPLLLPSHAKELPPAAFSLGLRAGQVGTHTSRTMMLDEAVALFAACPRDASRAQYREAIMAHNCLGKRTLSTRRASDQRLGELYALDPNVALFRVMRALWESDERGRPLLALLLAVARDPLLRISAEPVLRATPGEQIPRQRFTEAVSRATGARFNDEILDKIVRNAASSWTQSGHLQGRSHKIRCLVFPTPYVVAYALLEGFILGARGQALFHSLPARLLDAPVSRLIDLAQDAKRLGLLDLKVGGDVIEITFPTLLTEEERRLLYGKN